MLDLMCLPSSLSLLSPVEIYIATANKSLMSNTLSYRRVCILKSGRPSRCSWEIFSTRAIVFLEYGVIRVDRLAPIVKYNNIDFIIITSIRIHPISCYVKTIGMHRNIRRGVSIVKALLGR